MNRENDETYGKTTWEVAMEVFKKGCGVIPVIWDLQSQITWKMHNVSSITDFDREKL